MLCCCQSGLEGFFYFAYGSNMLKKRIHINNPSAEFISIGKLGDHTIDFSKYSENWCGAVATIVPMESAHVWGAIWRIHKDNLPALDKQEGVHTNTYFPKTVIVVTPDERKIECRTYLLTHLPPRRRDDEELPVSLRPSITYLDCIIKGALECKLPEEYVETLKRIPNNGKEATAELRDELRS